MSPEKFVLTEYALFFAIGIIGFVIGKIPWIGIFKSIKREKKLKIALDIDSEDLIFLKQYTYYGGYSSEERLKIESLDNIMYKFKTDGGYGGVIISSKFNGVYYAMFDLDSLEKYELFKKIYSSTPYAIFISSPNHYWGLLDIPYKKLNDIYHDTNWKVCNDDNYVSFTKRRENMLLRGLYENLSRKPRLNETHDVLSKNFQLFIDKLSMYYNNEGLELSVLKYKDPTMLIQFNRRRKLQQLNDIE